MDDEMPVEIKTSLLLKNNYELIMMAHDHSVFLAQALGRDPHHRNILAEWMLLGNPDFKDRIFTTAQIIRVEAHDRNPAIGKTVDEAFGQDVCKVLDNAFGPPTGGAKPPGPREPGR